MSVRPDDSGREFSSTLIRDVYEPLLAGIALSMGGILTTDRKNSQLWRYASMTRTYILSTGSDMAYR